MKKLKFNNINHNMKYYILNGLLFAIMVNLYKPFRVKFLERLGGTKFDVSLLNSLPGLVAVFTIIPGILLLRKFTDTKKITAVFFIFSRFFLLLFACIPFLPKEYQPIIFIVLIALMNFPESISQVSLQSFVGEIFLPEERSTAISSCKKYGVLIQIAVVLLSGQILSKLPTTEEQRIIVYQLFFVVAFIVGCFEISTFLKLERKVEVKNNNLQFKKVLKKIFVDKKFWGFTICSLLFHFGWQMGWPLFSIYQINYLHADEMWLGLISVAASISMFFSYGFWNKKIIKYGNSKIIVLTTSGMAFNAIITAISPNLQILTLFSVVSGVFTAGTMTVLLSLLLEVTPEDDRVLYIGIYNTLLNISLFISPFVGHIILTRFGIFVALVVVSILRLIGGLAFLIRRKLL